MFRTIAILAFSFFVASCANAQESGVLSMQPAPIQELPVIKVDEEHHQVLRSDGSEPPAYEMPPSQGLILDVTGYQFDIPAELNIEAPNMIQVVVDGNIYAVEWRPGVQRYVLSSDTLTLVSGSDPFVGYPVGGPVLLAIGYAEETDFYVLWAGMITVQR